MDEEYTVINEHYILIKSTGRHLSLKDACNLLNTYHEYHKFSMDIFKK